MSKKRLDVFSVLNTPLKVAMVSLVISEVVTVGSLWLSGTGTFAIGAVIAGFCGFFIAYGSSYVIFRYQKTIEEKNRQLEDLAQALQARNEELDAFAHTVAHDLKTPLTSLIGYGELAKESLSSQPVEAQREDLDSIIQGGRKMVKIVDELLLLSSVRKMEQIEIGPLDMTAIVREALSRFTNSIAKTQTKVVLPDEWPAALGYGPWVEEVWVNYISNALKYGGTPPQVELGATETETTVRFWVRDNGPGVTEEEQAKLFVPFTRLAETQVGGSGLGLSIAKRIVERLGGKVGLESPETSGRGSTFFFTLPRAK